MDRRLFKSVRLTALLLGAAIAAAALSPSPARADDHRRHDDHHDRDRRFHGGSSFGLFFGAPAIVTPPPVIYTPAYPYATYPGPYAPVPISGVYLSPYGYGYCRDYRTAAGIETACQQPNGLWRFIN
jgi:hypothetical protein